MNNEQIQEMLNIAKRLVSLLEAPEPGISMWYMALSQVMDELESHRVKK
jgi:hypothetical protein